MKIMETPRNTPEQTLERMRELLEKIEQHLAPPPLWKRILSFVFTHFFTLLTLLVLVFFIWKIWNALELVSENVSTIKIFLGNLKEGFGEKVDSLQFWK